MDTKTEILKTDLPGLTPIHCATCGLDTLHKVVASHVTQIVFQEDSLDTAMQIVRCDVCAAVSFRELYATRGLLQENSKGEWVDLVTEVRYQRLRDGERRLFTADESSGIFD